MEASLKIGDGDWIRTNILEELFSLLALPLGYTALFIYCIFQAGQI
jgi:hypothetical protein